MKQGLDYSLTFDVKIKCFKRICLNTVVEHLKSITSKEQQLFEVQNSGTYKITWKFFIIYTGYVARLWTTFTQKRTNLATSIENSGNLIALYW